VLLEGPDVKSLWVEPAHHLVRGQLKTWTSFTGVKPARIPGYWLDKPGLDIPVGQPIQPGEKILYRIHGGGYIASSARPNSPVASDITKELLRTCPQFRRAFSIEYRLSQLEPGKPPVNPFPAALLDILAGYTYLTDTLGIPAEDICVCGDSSGGNAALALVRYLVEARLHPQEGQERVPAMPGSLILMSPLADLGTSHETPGSSIYTNSSSDIVPLEIALASTYRQQAFLGSLDPEEALVNPYLSPASKHSTVSFKGFPKTFISAGGAEVLLDQMRTLKERMEADLGDGVVYDERPDAVHIFMGLAFHEPEKSQALKRLADWIAE